MAWMFRRITELERRMLKVEDPIEMKTEPGTEIVIPATEEEEAEDEAHHGMIGSRYLQQDVHIRGLGQVTPSGAGRRR